MSWTGGSVVGIEEHFVAKQSLDSLSDFITAALGHGASVPSMASFPCELLGDFLNADKQHGQPRVGLRNLGRACSPFMTGIARSITTISGSNCSTPSIASTPLLASPHTCQSGCFASNNRRNNKRMVESSSAIRIRVAMSTPPQTCSPFKSDPATMGNRAICCGLSGPG